MEKFVVSARKYRPLGFEEVVRLGCPESDLQITIIDGPQLDRQLEVVAVELCLAVARHAVEHDHLTLLQKLREGTGNADRPSVVRNRRS